MVRVDRVEPNRAALPSERHVRELRRSRLLEMGQRRHRHAEHEPVGELEEESLTLAIVADSARAESGLPVLRVARSRARATGSCASTSARVGRGINKYCADAERIVPTLPGRRLEVTSSNHSCESTTRDRGKPTTSAAFAAPFRR